MNSENGRLKMEGGSGSREPSSIAPPASRIAIACGGTGGHLFPGLAIAGQLLQRACAVTLLVSSKQVDQQAIDASPIARHPSLEIVTLPAVGLQRGMRIAFVRGFVQSYRAARNYFESRRPAAALAMGGFTSAPPILAARQLGARTFLHESNTIPGRANRWLSWIVDQALVGFPQAASRLHTRHVLVTGTPVRPEFVPGDAAAARTALGLDPHRPVLLVMGGSQGASGINDLVAKALPLLAVVQPELQWLHLTGPNEAGKVEQACAAANVRASVRPFLAEMHLALRAATVAISRAGASSLAELAAMRVPAVLVPFPAATDNHQFHNAKAFADGGAARLLEQRHATHDALAQMLVELILNPSAREQVQAALDRWHRPDAAGQIATAMLAALNGSKAAHDCAWASTPGTDNPKPKTAFPFSMFDAAGRFEPKSHHPKTQHLS
jgi:UDP-N-acetylglucosamine--N-acetylmuramyl-(pentapeptide) pyrophosphoryl-undecaprenol N-acetylglucosamine transferase